MLNKFVNNGSDEELLKSLVGDDIHVDQEELIKSMNKTGLVQKEVQVKGKNGQVFTRKQWVKASDDQSKQGNSSSGQKQKESDKNHPYLERKGVNGEDNTGTKLNASAERNGVGRLFGFHLGNHFANLTSKTEKEIYELGFRVRGYVVDDKTKDKYWIYVNGGNLLTVKPDDSSYKSNSQATPPSKGYVMEFQDGVSYVYLYTDKPTVASAKEAYERFYGKPAGSKSATAIKRSNMVKLDSDYVKRYCVNVKDGSYRTSDSDDSTTVKKKSKPSDDSKVNASTSDKKGSNNSSDKKTDATKLSKDEAKKKTQSLTSKVGKTDNERSDFMSKAKSQGITWKENDNAAINWMRCCMAMNKHFEAGGSWSDDTKVGTSSDTKKQDTKAKDKKKFRKVTNRDEFTNGIRAVNRVIRKDKGTPNFYYAYELNDLSWASKLYRLKPGYDAPITVAVRGGVEPKDFIEYFEKEFGVTPKHTVYKHESTIAGKKDVDTYIVIEAADVNEKWKKNKN